MNMCDLLNKAGFETADDPTLIDFTSIKDVCLPFGFWIVPSNFEATKYLEGMNYIRRNSTPFNFDYYKTSESTEITRWLKINQSICKVLPDRFSTIDIKYNGYLNSYNPDGDCEWKDPMEYGYSNVMFYFLYNMQFEKWEFIFSRVNRYNNGSGRFVPLALEYLEPEQRIHYANDHLFRFSEFVSIVIDKHDGCIISHKKYKNQFGVHDAVTSPCFGKNIKKHTNIMERLSNWIADGGVH